MSSGEKECIEKYETTVDKQTMSNKIRRLFKSRPNESLFDIMETIFYELVWIYRAYGLILEEGILILTV